MYPQATKEDNPYFTSIIEKLIIRWTGEKQTDGQTLSWNSWTYQKIYRKKYMKYNYKFEYKEIIAHR